MKNIILVDGNSIMYRAYYGTAVTGNLMQNSKGLYTNMIFAFVNMIDSLLQMNPDGLLVAFDAGKQTFRHEMIPEYKAGRTPMPPEMRVQIPYLKQFLDLMNVKHYELPLYEADDIIGTLAKQCKNQGLVVNIYSSDKDLLQLVDDQVFVNLCKKGIGDVDHYDKEKIFERYTLYYDQMIDLKALMGDPSDNLKGIPGVGEKTAIKLLNEYKDLQTIISHKDAIKGKLGERINNHYEDALLCQKMVTINQDSPIDLSISDIKVTSPNLEGLRAFFSELEFHSMIKKLGVQKDDFSYEVIEDSQKLADILIDHSYLFLEMDVPNYHKGHLLGMGISNKRGNFFIPLDIISSSIDLAFFLLEDNHKVVFGLKKMVSCFSQMNIQIKGVDIDLLLASYLANPTLGKEDLKVIAGAYGYQALEYDENIYGKGAKYQVPSPDLLGKHVAKKAYTLSQIEKPIMDLLTENNQVNLLKEIEMPLAEVLADVENSGMKISIEELNHQKGTLEAEIKRLEEEIYALAGKKFNIASPKQLADLLFVEMGFPCSKKTKTGYSTDSSVLEELALEHPIVEKILEYRGLTKLYSTYIIGLEDSIFPDGLVHTIFEQALTQTGRLSSVEPNLQNIPIRTELGKEIRKMFIPQYDLLFSADYSQIELRILAHMAHVKPLIDAFKAGVDIHSTTASHVFKTENVTPALRRKAKAVNFGIIYGISPFGLAKDIKTSMKEAKQIIESYFEVYPEIASFMDEAKAFALEHGYVLTMLNRRRYIPEIKSPNFSIREFGKRTAMNAPIQGSAADLIKVAMIKIYQEFQKEGLKSKMICQVHDELIFDCKKEELEKCEKIVREQMTHAILMDVPLEVECGSGTNWFLIK